jgi:hypothetical protein
MRLHNFVLLMASAFALGACSKPEPAAAVAPVPAAGASAPDMPSGWVGRWQGPEGTYLEVAGGPGTYSLTVQNLDGPRSFDAKAGSGTLVFVRDGTIETIRRGNGTDTGMKWLADKRDCLIVKAGEGYCRG